MSNFYFAPFPVAATENVVLFADRGAYTLSGVAQTINVGKTFILEVGAYTLTGQELTFDVSDRIFADHGEYVLTGKQTLFRYIRVPPPALPQPGEPGPLFENQWVPVQSVLDSCFTVDEG